MGLQLTVLVTVKAQAESKRKKKALPGLIRRLRCSPACLSVLGPLGPLGPASETATSTHVLSGHTACPCGCRDLARPCPAWFWAFSPRCWGAESIGGGETPASVTPGMLSNHPGACGCRDLARPCPAWFWAFSPRCWGAESIGGGETPASVTPGMLSNHPGATRAQHREGRA